MMTTTYARATMAQTVAEILDASLVLATANGTNVAGFDDVSPQIALFQTNARAINAEQVIRVALAKASFLTTAAEAGEDWFDQALSWYDVDNGSGGKGRIPARATVWRLRVVLAAGTLPITIGANSRELTAQADDETLFVSSNTSPVLIPSGSNALVEFTCSTPGTIGNQSAGNITHLVIGHPGLGVTNAFGASIASSGRDKETTNEATQRALAKWSTLGAGWTRASFDYLIPTVATTITRWLVRDDNPNGPGTIEVVMANASGPSTGPENAAVLAYLSAPDVMTLGTGGLSVISATSLPVTVTGSIVGDGSNPTLLANAKAALDLLRAKFPIGGDTDGLLRLDLLTAILMGGAWPASSPLKIAGPSGTVSTIVLPGFAGAKAVALTSPAADTAFALTDVLGFVYSGLVAT